MKIISGSYSITIFIYGNKGLIKALLIKMMPDMANEKRAKYNRPLSEGVFSSSSKNFLKSSSEKV